MYFTIPPWACPLCKNEETFVEIRNWTKKNNKIEVIENKKVLVCGNCTNKEGYGYAFGYVDKSNSEITHWMELPLPPK